MWARPALTSTPPSSAPPAASNGRTAATSPAGSSPTTPPRRSSFTSPPRDPEFLYELTEQDYTAPVPPGTPNHNTALNPIPGTGPYRIARADRTGVYFARNPSFREWSHAAQPNGHPNMIVWRYLPSQHDAAIAVQRGQADWFDGLIPLPDYRQLAIQSPGQLHTHPLFAVEFFAINTHLAPFDNVLVREALNYAIDRRAIAQMYGGPAFATPTCQPLAPGLPGYRRYCPYSSRPSATGAYTGPDLTYAKRLVAQSGTHGEHVTVWGSPDEGYIPPDVAAYTAGVLRSLGYRTTLHLVPIASITTAMYPRFQLDHHRRLDRRLPRPVLLHPTVLQLQRQRQQRLRLRPGARPENAKSRTPRTRSARRRKHALDIDRSHPDKPGRLGSDRERPRSRPRLPAPR